MDRTWKQIITPAALGIGACAACCAAPLLTLFVGAGAASSIAAVAEPVGGLLLASGFVIGGVVLVRRQRARAASCSAVGSCATDRSCGCGPALDVQTAQAAGCTLDAAQIPDRGEAFRSLFSRALTRRETSPVKAVWTLAWSQAVEAEARALAAAEAGCCSFFDFALHRRGPDLVWEARVPPGRESALAMIDRIAGEAYATRA